MSEIIATEPKMTLIGVLSGSLSDLSVLDLSPWNLKAIHISDPDLESYIIENSQKDSFDLMKRVLKRAEETSYDQMFWDRENLNYVVPIDVSKPIDVYDIFSCKLALSIVYPSDIAVKNIFEFELKDDKYDMNRMTTSYNQNLIFHSFDEPFKRHLIIAGNDKEIESTNNFFELYKKRADSIKYISTAIKFYSMSSYVNDGEMAFVSLCIALEGIVQGKEQLTYRFRRNIALLCGDGEFYTKLILKNAKYLYNYRSKLVHSDMKNSDYKHLEIFYDYARMLASRMILEMILHNISNIGKLNERLDELGFDDNSKISKDYSPFGFPTKAFIETISVELPKM